MVRWRMSLSVLLMVVGVSAGIAGQSNEVTNPQIVFVCEHGAAKSVIATAYFNKLAAERGLPDRATYRGANPQAELSVSALKGLREDGLDVPSRQAVSDHNGRCDEGDACFRHRLQSAGAGRIQREGRSWDDVPDDQGYAAQRDAIKKHVERLLDQFSSKR